MKLVKARLLHFASRILSVEPEKLLQNLLAKAWRTGVEKESYYLVALCGRWAAALGQSASDRPSLAKIQTGFFAPNV